MLPSLANLNTRGKMASLFCPLCLKRGSLQHVLSSCTKVFSEGGYRWDHDKVLRVTAAIVSRSLQRSRDEPEKKLMNFVGAGQKVKTLQKKTSVISFASDWQIKVDIGRQLKNLSVNNIDTATSGYGYLFG